FSRHGMANAANYKEKNDSAQGAHLVTSGLEDGLLAKRLAALGEEFRFESCSRTQRRGIARLHPPARLRCNCHLDKFIGRYASPAGTQILRSWFTLAVRVEVSLDA